MKIPYRGREYRGGHQIELLQSGESFFSAIVRVIDEAKHYIHFQTYILDEDETGILIVNALIRAARRGVRTYLLLDAFGTGYLSKQLIDNIESSGVFFRFFSPTFITSGFHPSLRLHSKVILADGEVAVIGGMNIANRYRGTESKKEWLDFALLFRGPECSHTLSILKKLWNRTFLPGKERAREVVHTIKHYEENVQLKVLQNNWYRNKIEVLRSYRSAIRNSQERMIIFASYFLPGRNERRLLRNASLRGVNITIVFSAESDAPTFARATSFLYDFILRNNIRIYEYLPSNLHAKVATVDGKWSTIGSYNMNHLSDYGSVELNVDVLDEGFALQFEEKLRDIIKHECRQVTLEDYARRRTLITRARNWWSYQMIRLILRIMWQHTSIKKKVHSGHHQN
jgi:cardiolipin synthase